MDQAVDPHLEGRVLKHAPYLVGFTRKILYLESFPDLVRRVAAKATAALSESGLCVLRQAVHPHRRILSLIMLKWPKEPREPSLSKQH